MNDHTPDRWMIVRITGKNHPTIDKVVGSWYGGFGGSDSWRMSSGIMKVVPQDDHYEVHNHSGSIYKLFKGAEGSSMYTGYVFKNMAKELEESGEGMMQIIDIKEVTPLKEEGDAKS
jgi:hypothetical protein